MTLPASIYFGFFVTADSNYIFFDIEGLLDFLAFLNHSSIFYTSYLTNKVFKKYVNNCLFFGRQNNSKNTQNVELRNLRTTNNFTH
jgi:hypothetical protein